MKGLMDRCTSHEMALGRLREKLGANETEVQELLAQKNVQIRKLDLTKQLLKKVEAQVKALKKILKDKEAKISEAKSQLCHAKDVAIKEYRDFDDLLWELGGSFANGFIDCIRQVKASFLDLDLSHINIDAQPQTLAQLISSVGTDNPFADDLVTEPFGDGETPGDKFVHLRGIRSMGGRTERTLRLRTSVYFFFQFTYLNVNIFLSEQYLV